MLHGRISLLSCSVLVRDIVSEYWPAEVLPAVQQGLASRVRGANVLTSLVVAQDFLRAWLEGLPHEIFIVVHLYAARGSTLFEMFRGAVTQTSVYPRKVVKDVLALSSSALLLAHRHPSACAEPSRVDEHLTQMQKGGGAGRRVGAGPPVRRGRPVPANGRAKASVTQGHSGPF